MENRPSYRLFSRYAPTAVAAIVRLGWAGVNGQRSPVASVRDHHDPHDAVEQQDHRQGSAPDGPPSHGYTPPSAHGAIVRLGERVVNGSRRRALSRLDPQPHRGYHLPQRFNTGKEAHLNAGKST